ncbi:MAG TPA: hypothetical protein VFQ22_14035 [Longimicrobiales bacterium]|nr:hypothetical protein [Longimicrobiales bacterium]
MLAASGGLAGQELTYSGGLSYYGGRYVFDAWTDAFYFTNGLRVTAGRLELGASLPVVVQNGGVVSVVAGTPVPTGGEDHHQLRGRQGGDRIHTHGERGAPGGSGGVAFRSGYETALGDPLLDASWAVLSGPGRLRSLRLGASVKAPLHDPGAAASSGAWDFALGASAVTAAGSVLLLADAAYWWVGDLPGLELRDGLAYALGGSVPAFSGRGSVMLLLSGMTRLVPGVDPPLSLLLSVGRSAGGRGFLSAGLATGLTESAPAVAVLVGWSVRLGGRG